MLQHSFFIHVVNYYFRKMRHLFLNLVIILFAIPSFGQDVQGWLIYFGNAKIKDTKFSIHHELQLRDYKIVGDHNQALIRVGAQYQLKPNITSTLGYAFIYTEAQDDPNHPFVENRIYQEMLLLQSLGSSRLRHRFRLEERFIEGQDFRGRFRYCLFAELPLTARGFARKGTYLALYDEVFLNIAKGGSVKVFDRNRAYAGLGYKFTDNTGSQLGYMRQNVGKMTGTNHVLLSLHHNFKF